jgi:hypothetical protein
MGKGAYVLESPLPYKSNILLDIYRELICMMFLILGYEHDKTINENILGFMAAISPHMILLW